MKKSMVVILMLVLAGVVLWLASKPDSAPQKMPELAHFDPADVFSVRLRQQTTGVISLLRSGEKWLLSRDMSGEVPEEALEEALEEGNEAANADAVLHLLHDLSSMEAIRVVTRNPKHYESLLIDSDQIDSVNPNSGSTQVTLKGERGNTLLSLFIGKQGSDLISTYLRVAGVPEVLAVNRVLLWQVRRSYQGWKATAPKSIGSDLNDEQE